MNVAWCGTRQAIRSRWLVRGMVGVCWLALWLSGRTAHAQGILADAVVTAAADDDGPVLEGICQRQALASWGQPIPAIKAALSSDATVFDPYATDATSDSAPDSTPPSTFPAIKAALSSDATVFDPYATDATSDSAPDSTPPSTFPAAAFAADRVEGATFGIPVPEQRAGTHLGAPQELAVLAETPPLLAVQYVSPTHRRELEDTSPDEGILYTTIHLSLPGPQRLFRLESEASIRERIRQEARQQRTPYAIEFPEEQRLEVREQIHRPRRWPLTAEVVEPGYVWHGRLLFEQLNSERYGWDMGILQPVLSAGHFYADVLTMPYHVAQDPWRHGDTDAGKCLPGDPVPLLLYPPQGSLTGLGAEAAVATLLFFALP